MNFTRNRLKLLRNELELSLRALGEYVDIPYSTIKMLEDGDRTFREIHLLKLCDFFDVTTDFLLGISNRGIGVFFTSCSDNEDHMMVSLEEYYSLLAKYKHDIKILKVASKPYIDNFKIEDVCDQKYYYGKYSVFREIDAVKEKTDIINSIRFEINSKLDKMDTYDLEKLAKFIDDYF